MSAETDDSQMYKVVINDEEQYSIWPLDRDNPQGWRDCGKVGLKADCLEYIKEVWTDMRPLSLRKRMEEAKLVATQEVADAACSTADATELDPRDDLIQFLSQGEHPVAVCVRPIPTATRVREAIDDGYVLVKFTDTRGGTELCVRLDNSATHCEQADFSAGTGPLHLEGTLRLNWTDVRCIADIELGTLAGKGCLRLI